MPFENVMEQTKDGGFIMKRFNLTIVLMMLVGFMYAHGNHGSKRTSKLHLKLWNNGAFKVVLNNRVHNANHYFNKNLSPGIHRLEVIKMSRNRPGNGFFRQTLYNGVIKVPRNSKVQAILTPDRKLKVIASRIPHVHESGQGAYAGSHGNHDCYNGCCTGGSSYYGMNELSFNQLLGMLAEANFDSAKLDLVEQALNYNNLTTAQVSAILEHFTFNSNKLKMAKMAYGKTIDKENYFLINNHFTFNSSIANLNKYIKNYG